MLINYIINSDEDEKKKRKMKKRKTASPRAGSGNTSPEYHVKKGAEMEKKTQSK